MNSVMIATHTQSRVAQQDMLTAHICIIITMMVYIYTHDNDHEKVNSEGILNLNLKEKYWVFEFN